MTDTDTFAEHRGLLVGVAYRVLGEFSEAEDIVQEAWLRWASADRGDVRDPKAYLVRVTTRLAIDRLRSAQVRRESYVGPWLPEPILTTPDVAERAELADSVSLAMLVVLETLSPLERVVFVLREVFGFSYGEIAEATDRSAAAVRQLAHRAHEHVQARRPRFDTDQSTRREATERFLAVCATGDVEQLMQMLAPDVTLVGDSGGKARGPRRPIHGAAKVARFMIGIQDTPIPDMAIEIASINGGPAVLVTSGGTPVAVFQLDLADGVVQTVRVLGNPDKIGRLHPAG